MSFTRSALFAALVAAASGCQREDVAATVTAAASTDPTTTHVTDETAGTYLPSSTGFGTAAPSGGGALAGVAVTHGTARTDTSGNFADPAGERQTRRTFAPRRSTSTTNATTGGTSTDEPTTSEPDASEPNVSEPNGTSSDSTDQGVGDGDTYDRNR